MTNPSVLMVAFHYPPCVGGSGIHRTLKFTRYLPERGWQPLVLSAHPRAYQQVGDDRMKEIPRGVPVTRAFALDNGRHFALGGRHIRALGLPDRWVSWCLGAVPAGLTMIRRYRPAALWSTYPIATAHLIGWILGRLTGLPWVADFRDSMTDDGYPSEPMMRRAHLAIERRIVASASRIVFTTRSTRDMYLKRYPQLDPARCLVIQNGYDEEDFVALRRSSSTASAGHARPVRLLHAGVLYTDDRDPLPLFRAVAKLKEHGRISASSVQLDLRASGSETYYKQVIRNLNIDDLVRLLPAIPYRDALLDCADADGLLVFQGASCNHQIPAKVYEYLRLRKPIFALTSATGDTADLLRENKGATIADLAREGEIYVALPRFVDAVRRGAHPLPDSETVRRYSRASQAAELAACLSAVAGRTAQETPCVI